MMDYIRYNEYYGEDIEQKEYYKNYVYKLHAIPAYRKLDEFLIKPIEIKENVTNIIISANTFETHLYARTHFDNPLLMDSKKDLKMYTPLNDGIIMSDLFIPKRANKYNTIVQLLDRTEDVPFEYGGTGGARRILLFRKRLQLRVFTRNMDIQQFDNFCSKINIHITDYRILRKPSEQAQTGSTIDITTKEEVKNYIIRS